MKRSLFLAVVCAMFIIAGCCGAPHPGHYGHHPLNQHRGSVYVMPNDRLRQGVITHGVIVSPLQQHQPNYPPGG